jgi:hypothetical protein
MSIVCKVAILSEYLKHVYVVFKYVDSDSGYILDIISLMRPYMGIYLSVQTLFPA